MVKRTTIRLRRLEATQGPLFDLVQPFAREDEAAWAHLRASIRCLAPGEVMEIAVTVPRFPPLHKLHMAIEAAIFEAQDAFVDERRFRDWLKVGAGHVEWESDNGQLVARPSSISYGELDDVSFRRFHEDALRFLRSPRARAELWPHLDSDTAGKMVEAAIEGAKQ